ncbi:hypothetical protein C7999DRAFT_15543, partial [Corynascus novoguineensis]
SRLSLAIFYSCNSAQAERIEQLLRGSPEVVPHPLLMLGVFAELQLNRMMDLLNEVHKVCDVNKLQFDCSWDSSRTRSLGFLVRDHNAKLREGNFKAMEAEEEMRAVRAQLKEMADHIDEQRKSWGKKEFPNDMDSITDRFKGRFREIDMELDGLMAQCRIAAQQQLYAGALFMSEISRLEAVASRHQAGHSTFLALVATCFLPVTSVATIFAVPAFKFDNAWVNDRFKPVGDPRDSGDELSSPSDQGKPVFSGYGIIFILISATLTGTTFLVWLWQKKRLAREEEMVVEMGQNTTSAPLAPAAEKYGGQGRASPASQPRIYDNQDYAGPASQHGVDHGQRKGSSSPGSNSLFSPPQAQLTTFKNIKSHLTSLPFLKAGKYTQNTREMHNRRYPRNGSAV